MCALAIVGELRNKKNKLASLKKMPSEPRSSGKIFSEMDNLQESTKNN